MVLPCKGLRALLVLQVGLTPMNLPSSAWEGARKWCLWKVGAARLAVCTRGGFVKGEWVGLHSFNSLHQFSGI